ncbi:MAG: hypothetical protein ACTSRZ_07030 [Promethearchaeota archaeon]
MAFPINTMNPNTLQSYLKKILVEIPYSSEMEIYDYVFSKLAILKGDFLNSSISIDRLRSNLKELHKKSLNIFRFECSNGFKYRYGPSKYNFALKNEKRFLLPKGELNRCFFCASIVFHLNGNKYHLENPNCSQNQNKNKENNEFFMLRFNYFNAIISKYKIYGVYDRKNSIIEYRLPGKLNEENNNIKTEFWLINETARKIRLVPPYRILKLEPIEKLIINN